MNQRIRELADQAELTVRTGRGNTYMSHPEFNKKFAELIVWECIEALAEVDESYIAVFQQHLLEHFGVES